MSLYNTKKGDYVELVTHGRGVTKVKVTATSKTMITIGDCDKTIPILDRERFRRSNGERVAWESQDGLGGWDKIRPLKD